MRHQVISSARMYFIARIGIHGLCAFASLASGTGCARGAQDAQQAPEYTVRGEVAAVYITGEAGLLVHHEEIPEFQDQSGNVVGMASMKMRFDAQRADLLSDIEVGDKVEMIVQVAWPALRIKSLKKLPATTDLSL